MRLAVASVIVLALLAPAVRAHHTVSRTHDVSHAVALTGVVTSIQWQNPHVLFHLAVPDGGGAVVDWEIESRHPQGMRQDGIDMDTIKVGDTLTINVVLALDQSHHAATISIVLPNGRHVRVCTVTNNACP